MRGQLPDLGLWKPSNKLLTFPAGRKVTLRNRLPIVWSEAKDRRSDNGRLHFINPIKRAAPRGKCSKIPYVSEANAYARQVLVGRNWSV